jgi:hypothetical protein
MKPMFSFLSILLMAVYPSHLFSQCAGGIAPLTITYDTIVYGNGNASRGFSFPKFDPSLGTLLSADLQSAVGLQYSYTLENQNASAKIYKTKIVRTDDIYSDALDPSSVNAVNQTPFVSFLIGGHQHLDYGPANMNYTFSNSISDTRLINFMGVGEVNFDYETGTSASVQGPLPWQLNFTSVNDTTHFSITYNYCTATLLSADMLYFTVTPLKDKILLNWQQAAIEENRIYSMQVSKDGQKFATIAAMAENKTGIYSYAWLNNASGNLYFRVVEKNVSGEIKYSNIREVKAYQHSAAGVRIFPTLYTGGNLQISFPYKAEWQIRLYSAEGRKLTEVKQTNVYSAQMEMPAGLSNGIYTAEVINTKTLERQVTRIVVQR